MGDIVKMTKLAQTLRTLADDPDSFYTGALAKQIVSDIQQAGKETHELFYLVCGRRGQLDL